jgi:hypothetical protein
MKNELNKTLESIRKVSRIEVQTGKNVLDINFYKNLIGSGIYNYSEVYTVLRKEGVTATHATQKLFEKMYAEKIILYCKKASQNKKENPSNQSKLPFISFEDALAIVKAAGCKVTKIEHITTTKETEL